MSETTKVITLPPPTANGPLHVGHLSGPYLATDIAARAARARGERVLVSTGIDVHQNWVMMRAEREGVPVEKMMAEFRAEIIETYRLAGIGYDNFVDSMDVTHDPAIDVLVGELIAAGALRMSEVDLNVCESCDRTLHQAYVVGTCSWCGSGAAGGTCEGCGSFTSAQDLLDPTCAMCGGKARTTPMSLPVLRMEDYRSQLTSFWVRAALPDRVRRLVAHYAERVLPDIPVAYPTNYGVAGSGPIEGMCVDVYAEVALTDFYGVARAFDPDAAGLDAYLAAWSQVDEVWHCHGIDNAFIYSIFWPALWAAAGLEPVRQAGMVVNEFYTLDGLKFSTSRLHAIWANELLTREDPALVRLYLAWDRPDRYGSDFTMASFEAFRARVQPLLDGTAPARPMDPRLLAAERERGLAALRLDRFDAALAARCLITLLEAGDPAAGPLLTALTGRTG